MSENTDEKLKPCPFCGGKAHLLTSNGSFLVECSVCLTDFLNGPVGIGWYRSEKDAAADWNDRPSERALITQLEAAQKRGDDIDENRKVAFELYQNTVNKLEAANEKLSKPIVLPAGYSVRAGHPINEGERNVMIPKEGGNWLSRFDVEHAIRVAGFTVEGE
ncbi:Lar family restriction alleviation protein [Yersinia enterocolitica]|uniref:Lar family restriction alleviation protein n=1 Tax=Yersinia enterocolitica TaxID=630 RepID=UPI003240A2AD|nr:Lar family restriction alleviation protein [Yersinia enterocolitica]